MQHLLKNHSQIVITIPLNDPLSPYVESTLYEAYFKVYDVYVVGGTKKTLTLLIINNYTSTNRINETEINTK